MAIKRRIPQAIAAICTLIVFPLGPVNESASAALSVTYGTDADPRCVQSISFSAGSVHVSLVTVDSKKYCVIDFKNSQNSGAYAANNTDFTSPVFAWTPPVGVNKVDYFIVGGGGGGGGGHASAARPGGGGGAGGVISGKDLTVSGQVGIAVGFGGNDGTEGSSGSIGFKGGPSAISTSGATNQAHETWNLVARGGGAGGGGGGPNASNSNGASGGGTMVSDLGTPQGISGQGNNGGVGDFGYLQVSGNAGGGGGKGGVGGNGTSASGGKGGDGVYARTSGSSSNDFGLSEIFAAGGGGGAKTSGTSGGLGGGLSGVTVGGSGGYSSGGNATAPLANTGSGGGGGGFAAPSSVGAGTKGSAGRVLIRYLAMLQQSPLSITGTSATFGTPFTLNTSGGTTGGTVSYTVSNGPSTSGCSISSGVLSSTSAGTCQVTATMAGDSEYAAVSSSQTAITMAKASRSLSFTTTPTSIAYGSTETIVATPSVGDGAVTYAATGSTACTINSSTGVITATQATGTCSITATVAEGTNYLSASVAAPVAVTTGTRPLTIAASDATVSYGNNFTTDDVLNVNTINLASGDAILSSGVTFTYTGTGSTSYGPSTTKPTDAGTYSVTPSAAVLSSGSISNYNVTYVAGTVRINKVARTISFGATTSANLAFGNTVTVVATASVGDGAVTYSSGAGCTVNSSTGLVTATSSSGTCSISATVAEGTNHLTASTTSSFIVTLSKRAITVKVADLEVATGDVIAPTVTVSVGSLVGSDRISEATYRYAGSGTTVYSSSATPPSELGTYSITPSLAVFSSGNLADYTVTYAAGTLTVKTRPAPASSSSPSSSPGPVEKPTSDISGVSVKGDKSGNGSLVKIGLKKGPSNSEQMFVVVRVLDLKGKLVEELKVPVASDAVSVEVPVAKPVGQFNVLVLNSNGTGSNAAEQLEAQPMKQPTIREASETKPAKLLGKPLGNDVLFAPGSTALSAEMKKSLKQAIKQAKASNSRISLTGFHASSTKGSAFEKSMAEQRALRVAKYLRNQGFEGWIYYNGVSAKKGKAFPGQPDRVEIRTLK